MSSLQKMSSRASNTTALDNTTHALSLPPSPFIRQSPRTPFRGALLLVPVLCLLPRAARRKEGRKAQRPPLVMADLMAEAAAPALGGELPISDQTSKEVSTHKRGGRDVAGGREGRESLSEHPTLTDLPTPLTPYDRRLSRRWGSGRRGTK